MDADNENETQNKIIAYQYVKELIPLTCIDAYSRKKRSEEAKKFYQNLFNTILSYSQQSLQITSNQHATASSIRFFSKNNRRMEKKEEEASEDNTKLPRPG